jgi:subtilisin family serine protease
MRRFALKRTVLALLSCLAVLALPLAGRATGLPARLDPRLAPALAAGAEPVTVWVDFADKGEQGPADLASRLARAERDLTPESRARRLRTGVRPLVDYLDLPLAPAYLQALRAQGLEPYGQSRWLNGVVVRAAGEQLARLATLDFVRGVRPAPQAAPRTRQPAAVEEWTMSASPAGVARAWGTGIDYGQTGGEIARLNVAALHDSGYVGTGVLVCMFDEGYNFYAKHSATRTIDVGDRTRDFVRGGTAVQDTVLAPWLYQHGQYTLSVIGGNAPGVFVGPAYGARYALARTEDSGSEKPVEMVNWLMASEWADSLGADVISSSVGYFGFPDSAGTSLTYAMLDGHTSIITRAVEIAAAKGILVVNAAGNAGAGSNGTLDAPADACGDSMLAVGAVDSLGVRASFSSIGPTADGRTKPDVMAQGVSVLLASASGLPDSYTRLNGTSFACPLTAGVAACLIQARPRWSLAQLVHAMKSSASRAASPDNYYGWGIVDAVAALHADTASVPLSGGPLRFVLQGGTPLRLGHSTVNFSFGMGYGGDPAEYSIRIYDITGRVVRTLWSGRLSPGGAGPGVTWDGTDRSGRRSRPGLYFASLRSSDRHATIRIVATP